MSVGDFLIRGAQLLQYTGGRVTLPPGRGVGAVAFNRADPVRDVCIPAGVHRIASLAFNRCDGITAVSFPEGVRVIGSGAFSHCDRLRRVTLPESLQNIGDKAFFACGSLTEIRIPDGVRVIGDEAFGSCTRLARIVLPGSLQSIGDKVFYGCGAGLSVEFGAGPCAETFAELPKGVRRLFAVARLCQTVKLDAAQARAIDRFIARSPAFYFERLRGDDGDGLAILLACCKTLKLSQIEEWLAAAQAAGHVRMRAVLLGERHKRFSAAKIAAYEEEREEKALGLRARTLAEWRRQFALSKTESGYRITRCKAVEGTLDIPAEIGGVPVVGIGNGAFCSCRTIRALFLPSGVRTVGGRAFADCNLLTAAAFAEGVRSIGAFAFSACENLQTVTLPKSLQTIGDHAFYGCVSLTIRAPSDSVAAVYAKARGIPFIPLDNEEENR